MNRRNFLLSGSCVGLGLLAPAARASLLPADPVFGRSFADLQGDQVNLAGFLGQPVLLNFWASWCAPCVREMPLLQSLHEAYPQLHIIGLAVDTKVNVERFLQKLSVDYPILLAGPQGISLMRELGNRQGGLPFSVLYKASGRMSETILGELHEKDIRARLDALQS